LDKDVLIQDSLQREYGNISAIARLITPNVEEKIRGKVNQESLITSIKRIRGEYRAPSRKISKIIAESVVNVRTDIAKISIEKVKTALEKVGKLVSIYQEEFLQVSESSSSITLIIDNKLFGKVIEEFKGERILEKEDNLGAITVNSPKEIIKTPGCAVTFYNQLSRRLVNIEDTVSCYKDTIIVVRMKDIITAFTALAELITESRTKISKGLE
jgi:hypothetical protein